MTQASRPAQDHRANFPTSDAGPYGADQWAEIFKALFSPGSLDQGPLVRYLNELEVTLNAAGPPPEFRVDTGAAMANGHFCHSDAVVDFTINSPAANPRIDRVVVLVNNTNALVTVSDLGFTLDFPDDLTDYNLTASVEPYSARLVIVQGVENAAPVAPGLDQNNNHFMVPLYQYEVDVAGVSTNEVDQREFCWFASTPRTRYDFVPAVGGYNETDHTDLLVGNPGRQYGGWNMLDNKTCAAFGNWVVPEYYDDLESASLSVKSVVISTGTGNCFLQTSARWGECGEAYNANSDGHVGTPAVTNLNRECIVEITPADFAVPVTGNPPVIGELMTFVMTRAGGNPSDTVNGDVYAIGFIIEYTAKG